MTIELDDTQGLGGEDAMRERTSQEMANICRCIQRLLDSGMTQSQVGARIGRKQSTVSAILSGRQRGLSHSSMVKLADACGITVDQMLGKKTLPVERSLALVAAITFAKANGVEEKLLEEFSNIETGEGATPDQLWTEIRCYAQRRSRGMPTTISMFPPKK